MSFGFYPQSFESTIRSGLQTQKLGKVTLPLIDICNQQLLEYEVCVFNFESSWGIDALIGLDFFRRFEVTVDYARGMLITKPFAQRLLFCQIQHELKCTVDNGGINHH